MCLSASDPEMTSWSLVLIRDLFACRNRVSKPYMMENLT